MTIYLVGYYSDRESFGNVREIMTAKASKAAATDYVRRMIARDKARPKRLIKSVVETEPETEWSMEWKYDVPEGDILYGKEYETIYRIETIECEKDDIPADMVPELERRLNGQDWCVKCLQKRVAELEGILATALSRLTMYDGGIYESRNGLLDAIADARKELFNAKYGEIVK